MRKELEAADGLFFFGREFERAQRFVAFERRLAALEQRKLVIEFGAFDFLAILLQPLHALFDHHQVAQDQLDFNVFEIAQRIHRALFVRHGVALKQAQHVRQSIGHAHAGQVTRIAQGFLGDGREVQVFHRRVRDLGRLENFRQGV